MDNQLSFDNDGHWEKVEPIRDEKFKKLEVGESLICIFVGRQPNTNFPNDLIYTVEIEDGSVKNINGTVDLDENMADVDNGEKIKITRLEDRPKQRQMKAKQIYKVERWVKEGS